LPVRELDVTPEKYSFNLKCCCRNWPPTAGSPLPGAEGTDTPATPAPSAFEVDDEFNLPISVAITILLIYMFVGATIYYMWEDWGFFESFYFVFISMSTIGFGDFVPQVSSSFLKISQHVRSIEPTSISFITLQICENRLLKKAT